MLSNFESNAKQSLKLKKIQSNDKKFMMFLKLHINPILS